MKTKLGLLLAVVAVFCAVPTSALSQCGPQVNDKGDLKITAFSAAPPDEDGLVIVSYSYATAVGANESIPDTTAYFYKNGTLISAVVISVNSTINGACTGEGWGQDCNGGCNTTGCDGGNGVCDCKLSPSGAYSKCKCVSIHNGSVGFIGLPGDSLEIQLDGPSTFAEDDECNNNLTAIVP